MLKPMQAALISLALTGLPAIAAESTTRAAPAAGSTTTRDDAMQQQCQKYQGAEREQCMKGQRGGQMGQHPALPEGGTTRQEVPGTGTTVPR
jgi:hypothetical protein